MIGRLGAGNTSAQDETSGSGSATTSPNGSMNSPHFVTTSTTVSAADACP